jgi:N-acetylmuramoyl-L-alanine amidase
MWSAFLLTISLSTAAVTHHADAFTARNLAYGCQGPDVNELQERLQKVGYYWGSINGDFDWKTYWAVRTFQYNFGMHATGFVDMETKIKLVNATSKGSYTSTQTHTSNNQSPVATAAVSPSAPVEPIAGVSASDMNLMAHMVYGEGRGEPFNGKVAIACVILNRMHDPRFPHTIPGILYSPGAFDALNDGQFNLTPDPSAYKAVKEALGGWDPTQGAVYYFNPATATSKWIWSRPQILQIGHHIFCR